MGDYALCRIYWWKFLAHSLCLVKRTTCIHSCLAYEVSYSSRQHVNIYLRLQEILYYMKICFWIKCTEEQGFFCFFFYPFFFCPQGNLNWHLLLWILSPLRQFSWEVILIKHKHTRKSHSTKAVICRFLITLDISYCNQQMDRLDFSFPENSRYRAWKTFCMNSSPSL